MKKKFQAMLTKSDSLTYIEIPFNPIITIKFYLAQDNKIDLSVLNYRGEKVGQLVNDNFKKSFHKVDFNAFDLSNGICFYKFSGHGFMKTNKIVLVK